MTEAGEDGKDTSGKSFQVTPPAVTLPKGGGAIRGMGEKFAANPVTGTGSMTVPIAASPGRSGFGPQLSLSYDSGAGNGPFGFGWSLSLPSITRKTDKGLPKYHDAEDSDVFILSGAEDLVPVLLKNRAGQWVAEVVPDRVVGTDTYAIRRYRPRIEGLFARIERWTNKADPQDTFWRSISKDNVTTWYGKTVESRIYDPADSAQIFSWLISQTHDDKGNVLVYGYKPEDSKNVNAAQAHERNRSDQSRSAQRYLKRIRYGNRVPYYPELRLDAPWPDPPGAAVVDAGEHWLFEVVFDYDEAHYKELAPDAEGRLFASGSSRAPSDYVWPVRNDPFSAYRSGFEVRTYRLCQRVLIFHHFPDEAEVGKDCLVRSTDFTYEFEDDPRGARVPIYSFLTSVTQSGYVRQGDQYLKKSLPPVEFTYSRPEVQDLAEEIDPKGVENLPVGLDGTAYQWTDLHGEGIPGILSEQGGVWFYKRNLSPINMKPHNGVSKTEAMFAPVEVVAVQPNVVLAGGQTQFMDLAGDGQPDLVTMDGPTPGIYEHDEAEHWGPFRPFASRLNRDTRDPNLQFVDLDGDGHADVLITEDGTFVWHESLAEEGFGPARSVAQALDEEKGPRIVFANGTQSIYLADLSGGGLTDIVRIRNGEVCYWPNLGYGRFGAKVTMDNAPWFDHPDQFDHRRIRLADIDGSGTTDIIYLHRDGVRLYFNQSGNSWSQPNFLKVFPRIDDVVRIVPTDLLGNGTACLVWSSALPGDAQRPMRYVNLMGSRKPHLLTKTINNLGAETHIEYAPSTKFYLQDKRDGNSWITKLPFPVHVVERVETYDHISRNRFVTRYVYHHGYFDGEEREFRGFGRVDQLDTEEFAALTQTGDFPVGNNVDAASHVPTVLTKTWFNTGAYFNRQRLETLMAREYYQGDAQASLLADTILAAQLSADEQREACRALKGAMLRQEVYALDGTAKAEHPYTVTEQNLTIRRVQPPDDNHHAVFFTHPREAINYHYERNPSDPRIRHALTLEVDDYGNVLKQAAIGYGRRQPDPSLSPADQDKQAKILITCTENGVTNAIDTADDHRTPLPSETRTYELTGLNMPVGSSRFTLTDVLTAGTGAASIAYEQSPTAGLLQKRLIEHVRTLYRRNDLAGALPLGGLEALALSFESYKLAFTPGLVAEVYGGRVSDAMLANEGRYAHSESDASWWIPSGRMFSSPDGADTLAQELAYSRRHFFLPHRYRNPFHTDQLNTETVVAYDPYTLLVTETRDAVGNRVMVANDYRVLGPRLLTDPNGNRSEVCFDALGMVAGTAVMGKPLPAPVEGDSLSGFVVDLAPAQVDGFFNAGDPHVPAPGLLSSATTRIIYDLDRFWATQQADPTDPTRWFPPSAATLARETHASDPLPAGGLKIQVMVSYSDGFGREIQKKIQAEPAPLDVKDPNAPTVNPRWVGSGWTVFNNKGEPVRQYEPFFTDTHRFEFDIKIGVSPVLFYDPTERVVATLHPNHTWGKVAFNPWRQETWDVNDAVTLNPHTDTDVSAFFRRLPDEDYLPTWHQIRMSRPPGDPERHVAERSAVHGDTPTVAYFDTLGRTFLTIAHNRFERGGLLVEEKYATRVELDIEGNQREVIDAKDRVVMQYDYDMLGNRIRQASMEAGERWMLNDVAGMPIDGWNSRGHRVWTTYDELRRPIEVFLQDGNGPVLLVGRTVYGEGQPNPETNNLRGEVYQTFDGAGIVTSEQYDFKGNLLHNSRQLAEEYKKTVDWSSQVVLETDIFTTSTVFDALNRPVALTTPDNSVLHPIYNEANLLERIEAGLSGAATAAVFVADIDYNAKGQRERIAYGNGAVTACTYDPLTFRLTRLRTTRNDGAVLQDLTYTYDPAGNITHIQDDAQQTIYFNNTVVEPHADYIYDAIYRLIQAEGREHIGQASRPEPTWDDQVRVHLAHPHDGQAMRGYTEQYQYDAVGNILQTIHQATNGNWSRRYAYTEPSLTEPAKVSNRLTSTTVGSTTESYFHDAHGNMTTMPHLPLMRWNYLDQLEATAPQVVNSGNPQTTYYVYDAGGQRVRKVTEWQAMASETPARFRERIYLGGFEVYREYDPSTGSGQAVKLERKTLHIMDDKQRIALVETKTIDTQSSVLIPQSLHRYQFGNHLGSASLELDEQAQIISYEEYAPYGSSTYQAVRSQTEIAKRYRYTGKEQDEESGFYYHGARYHAPWLGRWISCDPHLWGGDEASAYVAFAASPVVMVDPDGKKPLIANQFANIKALKKTVDIQYTPSEYKRKFNVADKTYDDVYVPGKVTVKDIAGKGTNELLEVTVSQKEVEDRGVNGGLWEKVGLALNEPKLIYYYRELRQIEQLAHAQKDDKGKGIKGTAIGHMSDMMYENLATKDKPGGRTVKIGKDKVTMADATRNMMLHVFGQALLTSLYGRGAADFSGDIHERDQPSLISGAIGKAEERQAIDNYADMVNNLYGQDIGERVGTSLGISSDTVWTPELSAKYLNAIQAEIGKEMGWSFKPFDPGSAQVQRFTHRLNQVTGSDARQKAREARRELAGNNKR